MKQEERIKAFEKDVKAYFYNDPLSEIDYSRLSGMFSRLCESDVVCPEPQIVIRTKIIKEEVKVIMENGMEVKCRCIDCDRAFIKKSKAIGVDIEDIEKIVSDFTKIPVIAIKKRCRKKEIVFTRKLVFYFAKKYTKMSLLNIGLRYGGMDHTTVIHSVQTLKNHMNYEPEIKAVVDYLDAEISYANEEKINRHLSPKKNLEESNNPLTLAV